MIINLGDEQDFQELVLDSPVPVIVDFWAAWCGPCRAQSPILDQLTTEQGEGLRVVKINVDEMPGLAQRYSIQAIPTLMLFSEGRKRTHLIGLQSLEDLRQALANA
jgi:thioredoxin 1